MDGHKLTASLLIALAVFAVLALFPASIYAQTESAPNATSDTDSIFQRGEPDITNSLCAGANLDINTDCNTPSRENQDPNQVLNDIIADIINLFSLIVGVVAVIMIIVGGFRYITSGGDSANVGAAKNTILYAIIGLVIVALSQSIVRFVLGRVIL